MVVNEDEKFSFKSGFISFHFISFYVKCLIALIIGLGSALKFKRLPDPEDTSTGEYLKGIFSELI